MSKRKRQKLRRREVRERRDAERNAKCSKPGLLTKIAEKPISVAQQLRLVVSDDAEGCDS